MTSRFFWSNRAAPALLAWLFLSLGLGAQVTSPKPSPSPSQRAIASPGPKEGDKGTEAAKLPGGFRLFSLGMGLEEAKEALKSESLLAYAGDEDVSLMDDGQQTLIDSRGDGIILRASLQFVEGKLYAMIFILNPEHIDHYSLFTTLSAKYGKPSSLSPSASVWGDESVRLSLEKPLTLKYVDMQAFQKLIDSGSIERGRRELDTQEFLNGL